MLVLVDVDGMSVEDAVQKMDGDNQDVRHVWIPTS